MGIEPGTFAGTLDAFLSFVHPDDRCLASPTDVQLAAETTLESEYRIVRPDGTVRILHETAEVIRDPDGTPIRLMGTCLDITERVAAEHDRVRLAAAVEQTADSIWMQDLDNNVSYVNRAFSRIYGFEPWEIVGRNASLVDSHMHPKAFFDEIWVTAAAGKTWSGPIVNRRVPLAGSIRRMDPGRVLVFASSNTEVVTHNEPAPLVIDSGPAFPVNATGTTLRTVFVTGSIRDNVLSHQLVTHTPVVSITTPDGARPTVTLAAT